MAGGSGSVSWISAGSNYYTVSVTYTVSWTSGSTLRSSSPASGSNWGGSFYPCGAFATFTISCSERLTNGTYNDFTFDVTGTAPSCPVATTPSFSDTTVATGRRGIAYSDGVVASPKTSYSINYGSGTLGSLGLSFSTSDGTITGTPTSAGSTTFTVTATNNPGGGYTPSSATTGNITLTVLNATPKVWNGSAWVYASDVKVWNGSAWVSGTTKVYDSGTSTWNYPS